MTQVPSWPPKLATQLLLSHIEASADRRLSTVLGQVMDTYAPSSDADAHANAHADAHADAHAILGVM